MSDAELSPDGSKLAAIAHYQNETRMIVVDLSSGQQSNAIDIGSLKARSVAFYDNDHAVMRVSNTKFRIGFRGEFEYGGAFAVNLATNTVKQLLINTPDLHGAQSGMGRIVGYNKSSGDLLMPAYLESGHFGATYDLFRTPFSAERGIDYMKGDNLTRDWFVDANGLILARTMYSSNESRFWVQRRTEDGWINVYDEEHDIPIDVVGVMPDGSGLISAFEGVGSETNDGLMKIGFDGEVSGPFLSFGGRDLAFVLTDDNRKIVGVQFAGASPDYNFLDDALRSSFEATRAALPNASIHLDSWSDDRDTVLYRVFDHSLGDVWLIHRQSAQSFAVAAQRHPDIPVEALGMVMSIEYKARDGLTIPAILTVPPGHSPGVDPALPALILPHGGPAAYDRIDFDWMAQYFANRGYAVLQPNFRGSDGFGRAFENAGRGEWGRKMQDDITDGIGALDTAGMIDPDRTCIAGASFGGYAALAGAAFTPDLYQCVIAIAPLSDLNKMLRELKRENGPYSWTIRYWEGIIADGDARRERLRAISPVNFAERVTAPVLLIHGDDDTVVPYTQSTAMHRALKKAGKEVELVKLKGEDHWLSVADTRMQTLREMDRFIAEHLPLE